MAESMGPPLGGDVSRAPTLDAVDCSLTGLAVIFAGCRLFTRLRIVRNSGMDDVFVTISIVSKRNVECDQHQRSCRLL